MGVKEQTLSHSKLLNDLGVLLERQISFARHGNLSGIELLSIQTESLIEEINRLKILELDEFKEERKGLSELYQELCLILTLDKDETFRELKNVRKSRKTVQAYHDNI